MGFSSGRTFSKSPNNAKPCPLAATLCDTPNNFRDNLKDKTYLAGLLLIAITFVACVISFWLLYYGIFIFALGTLLVFLSKKPFKIKLLITILPIIVYLPITYIFLLAYNYSIPKTFLIPADYDGTIRIVYEEKCGVKLHKENGRQIFQFPDNGILILNEKFDGGINHDYYLVDKSGKRTKVIQIIDYNDRTTNPPTIQVGGAGTIGVSSTEKGITFSDFYLYNKDTTLVDDFRLSQRFDSITNEMVLACRKK